MYADNVVARQRLAPELRVSRAVTKARAGASLPETWTTDVPVQHEPAGFYEPREGLFGSRMSQNLFASSGGAPGQQ